MNSYLAERAYTSLRKWDVKSLNVPQDEETIIAYLNATFSTWSYEIENVYKFEEGFLFSVVLYLPGIVLSGVGPTYKAALCSILKDLQKDVDVSDSSPSIDQISNVPTKELENNSNFVDQSTFEKPKNLPNFIKTKEQTPKPVGNTGVNDILNEIKQKKEQAVNNNTKNEQSNMFNNQNFNNTMNLFEAQQPTQNVMPEPQPPKQKDTVDFFSPEAEEIGKQVVKELEEEQNNKFVPSPETINPNNEITKDWWTQEQGQKAMEWSKKFDITNKDQFSAWTMKYCGLDYDHFNPKYIDDFIKYTEELRERQTY